MPLEAIAVRLSRESVIVGGHVVKGSLLVVIHEMVVRNTVAIVIVEILVTFTAESDIQMVFARRTQLTNSTAATDSQAKADGIVTSAIENRMVDVIPKTMKQR